MERNVLLILMMSIGLSAGCQGTPPAGNDLGGGGQDLRGGGGNDLGSGGGDMAGVSAEQACAAFAAAYCGKLQTCDPNQLTLIYGDMATCATRQQINCPLRFQVAGTPKGLKDCADAYAGASCGDIFQNNPPMACRPATGALAGNAVCGLSDQCSTSYCPIDPTTGCGKCITRQSMGGPCSRNEDCAYGLVCPIPAGATAGKCAATLGMGAACSVDIRCKWGLYCVAGKCAMPLVLDQACSGAGCDTRQGQFCNPGQKCAAHTYAAAGEMCGALVAGDTPCKAGALCKLAGGGKTGTCMAPVADGGACSTDVTMFKQCMQPAGCVGATCKEPDPTACH